ncbi:MAG: GNAT family N-acetyltransferase [Aliivibrio sp.]|uniref:GNAT family N-acetyltransferase n=1 Tax=Aliivibrio sp. TaxID=1872443 RepID=UPI001A3FD733|nr:GNAT family N-acetyltransferase [Aliivibrio sp.]
MHNLTFLELEPIKLPLVSKLYKEHYPAGRPKRGETIFIVKSDQVLIGAVRFQITDNAQLLTGMLIHPEFRGLGIGHLLLEHCKKQISATKCYCFSFPHLTNFYYQHHFEEISENQLPESLRGRFKRYVDSGKQLHSLQFKMKS